MNFWAHNILPVVHSHNNKPNERHTTRKHTPKNTATEEMKNNRT